MMCPTSPERRRFAAEHPDVFFLEAGDCAGIEAFLRELGLLGAEEAVQHAEAAGAGNMNCTLRVVSGRSSWILKQARPWVAKYPQFAAPWDRALRELEFYRFVGVVPSVARQMPRLIAADPDARLLVLEDVGAGADLGGIYQGDSLTEPVVNALASYLGSLHGSLRGRVPAGGFANREMRALNHTHMFRLPLEPDNGLDLEALLPGLRSAAEPLLADAGYRNAVRRLGEDVYLADGDCLLHGDFFPGSVLTTPDGPRVIDAEFAFFGRPEVDVGVFVAHLLLGRQPSELIHRFLDRYPRLSGFEDAVALQLAGIEMMRRLIGYAQLPLGYGLEARRALLQLSRRLVLYPDRELLSPP